MNRLKIELLFSELNTYTMTNIMNKYLQGITIPGRDKVWTIEKVDCDYMDSKGTYASISIYPKDYDIDEIFIYYEDKKFSENLAKITGLNIVTSEQGMQGDHYVNYDFQVEESYEI